MKKSKRHPSQLLQRLLTTVEEFTCSSMLISSDSELVFYRCTGLKEYNRERIVLDGSDVRAVITGNELELKSFSTSEITVSGRIISVSLERYGGEDNYE